MAAIRVGIDLCQNPQRVGCKFPDSVVIQKGSKGANLSGGGEGRSHDDLAGYSLRDFDKPAKIKASPELVQCFEDARDVAKSFFGSPNIKSTVVVVPSGSDDGARGSIEAAGNRSFIHVLQVIPEHIAVAAAYADKAKPSKTSAITIISSTSGVLDVHVVFIRYKSKMSYKYVVANRESQRGKPDHDEKKSEGSIGLLRKIQAHNPLALPTSALKDSLYNPSEKPAFETVVFVGKSAELEKMREIIGKGFTLIKEWNEFEDSEQLAAYGATVIAWLGEPVSIEVHASSGLSTA